MILRVKQPVPNILPLLTITAFFVLSGFSSNAQSIKLLRGPEFNVALTELNTVVKIPVTLVPDSDNLRLQLVDVSFDDPLRTVAITVFDSKLDADSFKNSFITININNSSNLSQGKYHLTFNIFKTKPTSPPEPLYLDLVVKPATLAPVSTLVVFRVQPFFGSPSVYKTLTLFETSHNAILSPVTIRELGLADATGSDVPASIRFKDSIVIPSGKQADFSYEIKGELPIGKVSGSYEICAPQLAMPVPFKMEIITKRNGWWIILLIAAGLGFGYITRTFLENRLQLNRSRKEAYELYRLLSQDKADRPDEAFGLEIDEMQKALRVAVEESGSDITAVIAAVRASLSTAYNNLNKRQSDLQIKLTAISDALKGTWFLPETIENALFKAETGLKSIETTKNNPGAGEAALEVLQTTLADNLINETENFGKKLKGALLAIRQSTLKIPVPESPLLTDIDELIKQTASIPAEDFDADPAKIKMLLQAVSSQRKKTGRLFSDISLAINAQLETLINIFTRGEIDLVQEILTIQTNFNNNFNIDSNKALDNAITNLAAYMKGIRNEFLQAMTSVKLGLDTNQIKTISNAVDAGNYTFAADSIVGFKTPVVVNESVEEDGSPETLESSTQTSPPADNSTGFVLSPLTVSDKKADASAINTRYNKIIKNIFWTSVTQNLLIGLGIAVFGYPLFAEKFTGTIADMIEVFSWSFVLNISINTLTTAAGSIPKKLVP